jgi:hypothetical protein
MKVTKENIKTWLNSPIILSITFIVAFIIYHSYQTAKIDALKEQIINTQIEENQKVIDILKTKIEVQKDTIYFYTKEIEKADEEIITANQEVDQIASTDSLISLYYKLRATTAELYRILGLY